MALVYQFMPQNNRTEKLHQTNKPMTGLAVPFLVRPRSGWFICTTFAPYVNAVMISAVYAIA